ncbi:MAG: helix-turn-helix domain-containing protein [Romboutsia sp.]
MSDVNIGEKIIEYRNQRQMTIKEVAEIAGVTPSLLSQIERGISNPSINTLKLISKALDVPLFCFFKENKNGEELVIRKDKRIKLTFPENNNLMYEMLSPSSNGDIQLMSMDLTPNTATSEDLMNHVGEEVAIVLEGKVDLQLENEVITLNQGDSVKLLPHMNHRWINTYEETSKIIFAVTPPTF